MTMMLMLVITTFTIRQPHHRHNDFRVWGIGFRPLIIIVVVITDTVVLIIIIMVITIFVT